MWGPGPHGAEWSKRGDRGWGQDDREPEPPEVTEARGESGVRQEWEPQGAPGQPVGWVLLWPQLYSETARQKRGPQAPHHRPRDAPACGCGHLPRPRGGEGNEPVETQTPGRAGHAPGVASPLSSYVLLYGERA